MKIRTGFVSNSSSASFIVDTKTKDTNKVFKTLLKVYDNNDDDIKVRAEGKKKCIKYIKSDNLYLNKDEEENILGLLDENIYPIIIEFGDWQVDNVENLCDESDIKMTYIYRE